MRLAGLSRCAPKCRFSRRKISWWLAGKWNRDQKLNRYSGLVQDIGCFLAFIEGR